MSIEIRKVKGTKYVTETRRVGDKVFKTHIGKLDEAHAEFLYRKGKLQSATRKRLKEHCSRSRIVSNRVTETMSLLLTFTERQELISKLSRRCRRRRKIMNNNSQTNLDSDRVKQAIEALPSKIAFENLCRNAELGDPQAMEIFDRLVEQTPELLESVANLVELAKALVIQDTSANSHLMKIGIEHKMSTLLKSLTEAGETDAITLMNAEILVVAYLDAMRCSLLASRQYDKQSDAEHSQRLADRAQKRYERAQTSYSRHLRTSK